MRSRHAAAACAVAVVAFWAYTRTLLPGVDLGDTGGLQAAVLWPEISARQAYPLYYTLARPFVGALTPEHPARALNLFSAVWAAAAVGLLTWIAAGVSGSVAGGAAAGFLLAFSYTFWQQAIIAEVYSLHLALVGLCLAALLAYEQRPTTSRLALFFAVYALAFGNHFSMILLFVPFAVFLFMAAARSSDLTRPAVLALAAGMAAAGALQYLPHLLVVWTSIDAPERWTERVAAFWFDVTKADWRESMVFGAAPTELPQRAALLWFDARQQFGIAGLGLAALGAATLWRINRRWFVLVALAWAINTIFAFSYNVGDPHVFYLPGHFFAAFAAGCAVAPAWRWTRRSGAAPLALAAAALVYAAWRGYDTWPAADRHDDRRAEAAVARLTVGISERNALMATQLNWQLENALLYETRYRRRDVVWTRLADVMLHFPMLVRDNHAAGRDVVLTPAAAAMVEAAFGSLLPIVPDPVPTGPALATAAARMPRGTPYVLCLLTPPRDERLDPEALEETLHVLTGGRIPNRTAAAYEVLIGRAGDAPLVYRASDEPFRRRLRLPEGVFDIRIDSWLALETFRRGGFGHVILDRRHIMALERGASLTWLDRDGRAAEPVYAAGLYAPQPRFRIPASGVPRLALLH